jgi:isoquinoline 1-oxidoreductase beta subunit
MAVGLSVKDEALSTSRRQFLVAGAAAGGGLLIGLSTSSRGLAQGAAGKLNAYVTIAPDGEVAIMAKNPDMGQGIKTALVMIIADELDADWSKVKAVQAPSDPARFGAQRSGGSRSIPTEWMPMRQVGAAGRAMLIQAAAKDWGVSPGECTASKGVVTHRGSNRSAAYGQLAARAAALPAPEPGAIRLKDPKDFAIIGKPVAQVDTRAIVTGKPIFGIDAVAPGMVYAHYVKSPVWGAKCLGADLEAARAVKGVRDVFIVDGKASEMGGLLPGVAIVADSWWSGQQARNRLNAKWEESAARMASTEGFRLQANQCQQAAPLRTERRDGDVEAALKSAAKTVEAKYAYPWLAHASLEPQTCTAHVKDGKAELWVSTQNPQAARDLVARTLGLKGEDITVHVMRAGGAFGRRGQADPVVEAAWISRHVGAPVKLIASREDDMKFDFYRPAGFHHLKGGVDAAGDLVAWQDHFVTMARGETIANQASMAPTEFPAGFVPNFRYDLSTIQSVVPIGSLRAPRANALSFVIQSFMDELAHAGGRDPVDFRLKLLAAKKDGAYDAARMAACVRKSAEMAGWGRKLPARHGLGTAFHYSHSGYVSEVVEVKVEEDGTVRPLKVWAAVDVGRQIVNPSGAISQVEGSILDGLSCALHQRITIENGACQQGHFGDNPLMRISEAPQVETHFILSDNPPTGLGEPALPPSLPALANAVFAATGKRLRELPIDKTLLKA